MRKSFFVIFSCVAILLAAYAGFRGYRVSKNNHLLGLARQFLAKSDGRSAVLCVQQVLRSDPRNIEATRLMAGFAEAARSPSALILRSRVVELNPRSLDDHIALAQTAVMFRDYASANRALAGVDPENQNTVRYQLAAGAVSAAAGSLTEAEVHFLQALKLEPQNTIAQVNLAVVQLHGTNSADMDHARNALQAIRYSATNSVLRCQVLRELTVDAMRHQQANDAVALVGQLLTEPGSAFPDRLLQLDVLLAAHDSGFASAVTATQMAATNDPGKVYEMAFWQLNKTSPREALDWLNSLPAILSTNQSIEVLGAECRDALKDWPGLQAQLENQNWGDLEFIRHAYLCRAVRNEKLADSAKAEWELTFKLANGQKERLEMLLRFAAQWGWQNEGDEILWAIVERYPGEMWAIQSLTQSLMANGRTQSILQLYKEILRNNPSDPGIKNNLAFCALLLNVPELKPHDLAREVYLQSPTNSTFITTYAFSLYLQGRTADALKAMQMIPTQELQNPSIAGYYAIVLQATGNADKARPYFDLADKARLLPEEKQLFARVRSGT